MATFEVLVKTISIEPHPNADRLELAIVGGYKAIVKKGEYKTGDLAAYIPEQSLVPDDVLIELGLQDIVHKNKIKAIRLRGTLSQGILYPINGKKFIDMKIIENQDVTKILGVEKYVPQIPKALRGKVKPFDGLVKYDIENIKKYPDVILQDEEVIFTEKIHGTLVRITSHDGVVRISSKGIGNSGLAFTEDTSNTYTRAYDLYSDEISTIASRVGSDRITVFGEVFGRGIQDLNYNKNLEIRVFDIHDGNEWLSTGEIQTVLNGLALQYVPIIWKGKFSQEILEKYTSGKTQIDGADHIREGIVIRPDFERESVDIGRVILKSISADYLVRKGGTEYD